jgi:hypothetical protein
MVDRPQGRQNPARPPHRSILVRLLVVAFVSVLVIAGAAPHAAVAAADPEPPAAPTTLNDFYPAERDISDCLSVLPKPGCGSEARGGWAQTAVFGAIMVGLAIIATRIVVGLRRRDAVMADD